MRTGGKVRPLVWWAVLLTAASAGTAVAARGYREAPPGTPVTLVFDQALNSQTAKVGETVKLHVANDVAVGHTVVIRAGTPVTGVLAEVRKREHYGVNASMRLALNPVRSVSGAMIPLQPRTEGETAGKRTGQAAAGTVAGAAVLGPVGLVGGYFVSGQAVSVKRGDRLETEIAPADGQVGVPPGTEVVLIFDQALSSDTAKVGERVRMHVADDVMVGNDVVIRKGVGVSGVIAKVGKRERYGVNASMRLALNPVRSVSGTMIPLRPRSEGQRVGRKTGEAAAGTVAGAALLGPVGLVGGYFVAGQKAEIRTGDKLVTEAAQEAGARHHARHWTRW